MRTCIAAAFAILALLALRMATWVAHWHSQDRDLFDRIAGLALQLVPSWAKALLNEVGIKDPATQGRLAEFAVLGLLALVVMWRWKWPHRFDFFFFSPFDRDALLPITRQTGLLNFTVAMHDREHLRVQRALLRWASAGAGHRSWGAWWFKPRARHLPRPFSWIVIGGPAGVGKTQAAMEFGRRLARRRLHGDSGGRRSRSEKARSLRVRAKTALRRIAWWGRRARRDAWDAGIVHANDPVRMKALAAWRPRRPTLLVLDDPQGDAAARVLETLRLGAPEFWHPVRLVIVDRDIPAGIGIRWETHKEAWDCSEATDAAPPVVMRDVAFDGRDVRNAQPHDGAVDLKLRTDEDYEKFIAIVGGNPMMVALGLLWLRSPGNSLERLVAARDLAGGAGDGGVRDLLKTHVDAVARDLEAAGLSGVPALKAIACATLAGGIPLEAARKTFGLDVNALTLRTLFPDPTVDPTRILPPVRPPLVGERLVLDRLLPAIGGDRDVSLNEIVREALRFNPAGVWQTIERHGGGASGEDSLARAFTAALDPKDPSLKLPVIRAITTGATRGHWDSGSLGALEQALAELTESELDALLRFAEATWHEPPFGSVTGLAVYCLIARFWIDAAPAHADRATRVLNFIGEHFEIIRRRGAADVSTAETLAAILHALVSGSRFLPALFPAAGQLRSKDLRQIHRCLVRELVFHSSSESILRAVLDALPRRPPDEDEARGYRALWESMAQAVAEERQPFPEELDALVATPDGPYLAVTGWLWAVDCVRTDDGPQTPESLRADLERLEGLQRRQAADDEDAGLALLLGYDLIANRAATINDAAIVNDAVRSARQVAVGCSREHDAQFQGILAEVIVSLACFHATAGREAEVMEAANEVMSLLQSSAHESRWPSQCALARAWRAVVFVRSRKGDLKGTSEAVNRVFEIARRPSLAPVHGIQMELAWCWELWGAALAATDPMGAMRAAREVWRIAQRRVRTFDLRVHERLVEAWEQIALNLSYHNHVVEVAELVRSLQFHLEHPALRHQAKLHGQLIAMWRYLAEVKARRADVEGLRYATRSGRAIAARVELANDRYVRVQAAALEAQATVAFVFLKEPKDARAAAAAAVAIGGQIPIDADSLDALIQSEVVKALAALTILAAGLGDLPAAREAHAQSEIIGETPAFQLRTRLQRHRLEGWRGLVEALSRAGEIEEAKVTLKRLRELAMKQGLSADELAQQEIIWAEEAISKGEGRSLEAAPTLIAKSTAESS